MPRRFGEGGAARADVKVREMANYRKILTRLEDLAADASPWLLGTNLSFHDAYAFTLLRWAGYAGIDPAAYPVLLKHVEKVMAAAPVAAALERERIKLDTYKAAA